MAKWYRYRHPMQSICWENVCFFCFLYAKSKYSTNIASVQNELRKKIKKMTNKESERHRERERERNRKRSSNIQVQLILSVEQSIKIFHANAVIHSTPARTLRPANQISNENTELYTAFKMHANVT